MQVIITTTNAAGDELSVERRWIEEYAPKGPYRHDPDVATVNRFLRETLTAARPNGSQPSFTFDSATGLIN